MELLSSRTKEDMKRVSDANWTPKRELGRLAALIGHTIVALISSGVFLLIMWLPFNDARDPWQVFAGGNPFGEGAYFWGPLLVAIGMFVITLKELAGPLPRFRRPK